MNNIIEMRLMDIILLVIMIPTLLVMYFREYPKNWPGRKFILGIRNREEFRKDEVKTAIDTIVSQARRRALIIMIVSFVLMGLVFLIPDDITRVMLWTILIIVDLIVMAVPFMRGNKEMKTLKRQLGIVSAKGTTYVDLKGAGTVRALKPVSVIIPNIVAAAVFVISLLIDLKIIDLADMTGRSAEAPAFSLTSMNGSMFFIGLIMIPIAIMMDKIRNEVISDNSDINMNYNRAKKKVQAGSIVSMCWLNTGMIVISSILIILTQSSLVSLILLAVYMVILMAGLILMVTRMLAIDRRYAKDMNIEADDDDKWILGSFYYNPDDRRLNVEKRMGVGATINIGHPAGKVIMAVSAVFVAAAIFGIIFIAILAKSPMTVRIDRGTLVCNQLIDTYKVPLDKIRSPELLDGDAIHHLHREVGTAIPPVFTGTFAVDGQSGCNVFLNLDADRMIRFEADGRTYYISAATAEDTERAYYEMTSVD